MGTREVWEVEIASQEYCFGGGKYHVFATSACEAERIGMRVAKEEEISRPYCRKAQFAFYVYEKVQ